jgi:hypothetical protein
MGITGVTGTLTHGSTVTLTGSGFGTKSPVAPAIWDNCSGTSVQDLWVGPDRGDGFGTLGGAWTGDWPYGFASLTPYCDLAYRTPIRGVSLPHTRVGKYMAGGAQNADGSHGGGDLEVWHRFTDVTYPFKSYISYYYRMDPAWYWVTDQNWKIGGAFKNSSPADSNCFLMYAGTNYYPDPPQSPMYYGYMYGFGGNQASGMQVGPPWDENHLAHALAKPWETWVKHEIQSCYDPTHGSYHIWEDGMLAMNHDDECTDSTGGSVHNGLIGGYHRPYGEDTWVDGMTPQWRYWADMYVQQGWSRVVLGNASTLPACTVCEVQIPSTWSSTSIAVAMNLGAFGNTDSAYLFVVDSDGVPSAGYGVTLGDGGGLAASQGLIIVRHG